MSSLQRLNPNAMRASRSNALMTNIAACKGLQEVLCTNLGPRGTIKMLVSGGGQIKLTKDGNVLLTEMAIQHPTASIVARTATSQDDITGDGTTSMVLLVGELMKMGERYISEGLHPRVLADGFDVARKKALVVLERLTQKMDVQDRELLTNVARTSLRTKLRPEMADKLTDYIVDAVLTVQKPGKPIDLFMVEIQTMQQGVDTSTKYVRGLVLDHGTRHPAMPKRLTNCFVLICNASLEYEKSEYTNTSFQYATASQRDKMVDAERSVVDDRVRAVIELKRQVCEANEGASFVVINQKGIDPASLDMLAKEGIMALRRAKRRNMERLMLACGGEAINSFDNLSMDVLGRAGLVYEQTLGEEKFTFVEEVENPLSVSILIKGPNSHTIQQQKDAVRDGLRAVKNVIDDGGVVPGAGAFEVAAYVELMKARTEVEGRAQLGVQAFANALLIIPKSLARNAGLDAQDVIIKLQQQYAQGHVVGVDLETGEPMDPAAQGIWDNYKVKRQLLQSASIVASQLMLVDEILQAGVNPNQ